MNYINWFWMDEEFCIGCTEVDGKTVFLTEEAERFEAPRIGLASSLRECMMRKYFFDDEDDVNEADEETIEAFANELAEATKKYVKIERNTMLYDFLEKMDKVFSDYKDDDIMTSYKFDRRARTMWLSKEDMETDHNYMWCALDGAISLWNMEHSPYYIVLDESAPDENGMIKYEFEICCKDDYEDLVQDGIEE